MKKQIDIKVGDTVEYTCVAGVIHVEVLKVKSDGNLILHTRKTNKLVKAKRQGDQSVSLSKNVCVLPHRVRKI